MEVMTQHGYLVLADISGYSTYLAGVELDHAHGVLTDLLELIIERFRPALTISKLEGDAVFAYVPGQKLTRGETLLEVVESTYVAFRDRVEAIRRRTSCECRACRAIPSLDLKFLLHYGEFMGQTVSGIRELVGTDVNLVHRLLKNHVSQATGWRAYMLLSQKALFQIGVPLQAMHTQEETYDLGTLETYSVNLGTRYQELVEARRVYVRPEEAYITYTHDYPVPPAILWDWLNDPYKRAQAAPQEVKFVPVDRPAGRTGAGARNHCVHGKNVAMRETVLDWRPFEYFTVEQMYSGFVERATFELEPLPENRGTRLTMRSYGRSPAPGFLNKPVFMFVNTKVFPFAKVMEKLGRMIDEAMAREQTPDTAVPVTVGVGG